MNYELYRGVVFDKHLLVTPWTVICVIGTLLFASRWLVQMYHSRLAGKPVTPRAFWVMSVAGSLMTLAYFALAQEVVGNGAMMGVLGNLFPSMIASYNLYLDLAHRRRNSQGE